MYKENWNEVDRTDIEAYIGLLILCGVYKSRNENVASYGMQTQVGQTFARHMHNLFVSHVNKITK